MNMKELTCIQCPLGCQLQVALDGTYTVTGNACPRGAVYAKKEVTAPTRTITSTIPVSGGEFRRVSVKTADSIPKDKIFECMDAIKRLCISAPIHINEILLENCAGTGIPLVATREVKGGCRRG